MQCQIEERSTPPPFFSTSFPLLLLFFQGLFFKGLFLLVSLTAPAFVLCMMTSYRKCIIDCQNSSGQEIVWSQFIPIEIVFESTPCFTGSPLCLIPDVRYVRQMLVY